MISVAEAKLMVLRDHAWEQLELALIQAHMVQTNLSIADDIAMGYALRRLVHHIKEIAKTANEIAAAKGDRNGEPS